VGVQMGDNGSLTNCHVHNNTSHGVSLSMSDNSVVGGNVIDSNGGDGILFANTDDAVLEGNRVMDNTGDGIVIPATGCDNNTLTSNRVTGHTTNINDSASTTIYGVGSAGASSTDNALTRWDGADGSTVQSSNVLLNDIDQISAVNTCTFDREYNNGTWLGSAKTVNWNNGQKQRAILGINVTLTLTDPPGPSNVLLRLIQDATGGRTVTWPASVMWPGGTPPTLSAGANAEDIVTFYYNGTTYYGVASLNFS
jgi:parallel beta-helix repeat protein